MCVNRSGQALALEAFLLFVHFLNILAFRDVAKDHRCHVDIFPLAYVRLPKTKITNGCVIPLSMSLTTDT